MYHLKSNSENILERNIQLKKLAVGFMKDIQVNPMNRYVEYKDLMLAGRVSTNCDECARVAGYMEHELKKLGLKHFKTVRSYGLLDCVIYIEPVKTNIYVSFFKGVRSWF